MRKSLLVGLGLLSLTGTALAANASLPLLKAYELEKNLLVYTLTSAQASLVNKLIQQGNKNHLVIVDNKGDVLATMQPGAFTYQFSLVNKNVSSIRLAESFVHNNRLYDLTQPLKVSRASVYSAHSTRASGSYQNPRTIQISTAKTDKQGDICGTQPNPCQLYINGHQQLPVYVNYNSSIPPGTPWYDFPPADFSPKHLTFTDGNGNVIPINGDIVDGIHVSTVSEGYEYGQVSSAHSRGGIAHRNAKQQSLTSAANKFYVSFEPNYPAQTVLQLNAQLTVPGSKTVIKTNANRQIFVSSLPSVTYAARDFNYVLNPPQFVTRYHNQIYRTGYIYLKNGIHDITYVTYPGQNGLISNPSGPDYYGWVGQLPWYKGSLFANTGETQGSLYTDGQWDHISVYLDGKSLPDPNNLKSQLLPVYLLYNVESDSSEAPSTKVQFAGKDVYGNPFNITVPFVVKGAQISPVLNN